jgi:hypothetical protein
VHLTAEGLCADRSLVEVAMAVWLALGITGVRAKDAVKAAEYTNKAERSRVMYASKVAEELADISRLFDAIDAKAGADQAAAAKATLAASKAGPSQSGGGGGGKKTKADAVKGSAADNAESVAQAMSHVADFFEKQKRTEVRRARLRRSFGC